MDRGRAELFGRVAEAMETAARLAFTSCRQATPGRKQRGRSDGTAGGRACSRCRPTSTQPLPNSHKRRRDGEPKIIPSPQAVIEGSGRAFDDLLERAGGREVRAFDDAAGQEDCRVVEVAEPGLEAFWERTAERSVVSVGVGRNSHPSHASGPLSDIRQLTGVVTGYGLPSRGNAAARSGGAATASRGTWRPRLAATLPPAAGHPRYCLPAAGRRFERATPTESDRLDP